MKWNILTVNNMTYLKKIMKKYQNSDIYVEKIDFPRNFSWKTCQFRLVLTG